MDSMQLHSITSRLDSIEEAIRKPPVSDFDRRCEMAALGVELSMMEAHDRRFSGTVDEHTAEQYMALAERMRALKVDSA